VATRCTAAAAEYEHDTKAARQRRYERSEFQQTTAAADATPFRRRSQTCWRRLPTNERRKIIIRITAKIQKRIFLRISVSILSLKMFASLF
jgi:hypothetical protein